MFIYKQNIYMFIKRERRCFEKYRTQLTVNTLEGEIRRYSHFSFCTL